MENNKINIDMLCGEILRICWDGTKIFDTCDLIKRKIEEYVEQEKNSKSSTTNDETELK